MQDIRKLNARISVTSQITVGDIPAIRLAGFSGIICNRPDGEEAGQTEWREIETAARKAGLKPRFVPLAGPVPTDEALARFARAVDDIDGAILAYCRTGKRSEILWNATKSLAQAAE